MFNMESIVCLFSRVEVNWCQVTGACYLLAARFLVPSLAALLVGKVRHSHLIGLEIDLSNDGECFHEDSCCG